MPMLPSGRVGSRKEAILVVGHGSRDARAIVEFEELVARLRLAHRDNEVHLGYIELAEPLLPAALAELGSGGRPSITDVVVLPVFLFAAGHVKHEIPLAVEAAAQRFPGVRFHLARPLGLHPQLHELLFVRVMEPELAWSLCDEDGWWRPEMAARTTVVVVGRGSSDAEANAQFFELVRRFGDGRGFAAVVPCFIGISPPFLEETLEGVARARPEQLLVVPYMIFDGVLVQRLGRKVRAFCERYPSIRTAVAPHLGIHGLLLSALQDRLREAEAGQAPGRKPA